MAAPPPSSSSSPPIRSWRTAFLTLRDETLTTTSGTTVLRLLRQLIFSQSENLIAAAPHLPPHEVTSDVLFLMDLIRSSSDLVEANDDIVHTFTQLTYLVQTTSHSGCFEFSSSSWALVLDFFGKMVEIFLGKTSRKRVFARHAAVNKAIKQFLEIIRLLSNLYQRACSVSDNVQLLNFLLTVAACSDGEIYNSSLSSGNKKCAEFGKRAPGHNIFWENQIIAFSMIGEVFSRVGSSFPTDVWQSTIENLRKVMDMLASRGLLAEDNVLARFYTSLLNCLHLVLTEPKGSLSDHVTGFVAALSLFINFGITSKLQIAFPVADDGKELNTVSLNVNLSESSKPENGLYRPPHLRRREWKNMHPNGQETSGVDPASSDSDYSDSDVSASDTYNIHCSKARVAAIICIQDLCRADPKLFTSQWTLLLPSSDVLHMRKYQANLLTCLLFDPHLKARIASASALATMLDGPASVFLQVAEYKESSKCGSFTALSSSLGQILMQLHSGILYLIQHENHTGLLVSLFKVFMLLISSTPYSRMPGELLATVISSLCTRIEEGFPSRSDQTGLLAVAFNCLTTALSTSSSAFTVREMFSMEGLTGCVNAQGKSGVLLTILRYSEPVISPTISFEALQALRAVAHNCPDVMVGCWKQISFIVYGFLRPAEVPARSWKGNWGNSTGALGEKVTTAAIKVLDECLRAISGFKGTEDLIDDKFLDNPFTSDYVKTKTISSAPSYGSDPGDISDESDTGQSGSEQWSEALEKHMPLILGHTSAMVRAASVTCFAGITSSVFFSLPKEKQRFVTTSSINAAVNDEVPSVRSAGCRAMGVIACFPKIFNSAEILDKFIHAAEINTHDPLVSVRVTASWALANLCDSLRHCVNTNTSEGHCIDSRASSGVISLLIDCAMQLTKDGDKVKANAVRALGNLSRFVLFPTQSDVGEKMDGIQLSPLTNGGKSLSTSHDLRVSHRKSKASNSVQYTSLEDSHRLERMVQAFLSCVTTGNVKVQWNVCHALSNLFLNETLDMQVMDWAPSVFSVLLLLLRDSSNFKIRIQAAAALAVPGSIHDYGRSFADVIQGVEHILESFNSDRISGPSSFKYRVALEKQLTATMLHVLALASSTNYQPLQDFLVKKASFLEEWLKVLCSSLGETINQHEASNTDAINQKKEAVSKAIKSLIEVYEGRNHHVTAGRLNKLTNSIQ